MTPRDRWIYSDESNPDEARRIRDGSQHERPLGVVFTDQARPPRRIDWLAVGVWLVAILAGAGVLAIIVAFLTFLFTLAA